MRILTIDLDILMHDRIPIYEEISNMLSDPKSVWWQVKREHPTVQLDYDSKLLVDLGKVIQKQECEIIFIDKHSEVVPYIKEPCDLTNVDFHHDIYYASNDYENDIYGDGNWVGYLDHKGLLKTYTWYGAPNSKQFSNLPCLTSLDYHDVKHLGKFDKVFICKSPSWTPPVLWDLFDLLKNIYEVPKKE